MEKIIITLLLHELVFVCVFARTPPRFRFVRGLLIQMWIFDIVTVCEKGHSGFSLRKGEISASSRAGFGNWG